MAFTANTDTCRNGGHPWVDANIYVSPKGHRTCRACMREAMRRHQERKRGELPPRTCACGRDIKGRAKVCAICKDSRRDNYSISDSDRAHIYERDGHKCLRCGDNDNLTIDHILPRALGGKDMRSNYQTLCRSCNTSKGATYADYRPGANNQLTLALEPPKPSLRDRFMEKVEVQEDGCWLWTGARNSTGTPVMKINGRLETGARASWSLEHGEMPEHQVYRACGGDCVNPKHLTSAPPLAGRCRNGHAYTAENTKVRGRSGERLCVSCREYALQRYYERKRAQARA